MEQLSEVHVDPPTPEQTPGPVWTGETLFLQSHGLRLEARLNGRARVSVVVSQNEEPLLVDTIEVVSASARTKAVEALPEELRDDGVQLLERAAVEVLRFKPQEEEEANSMQGRAVSFPDPEPWPETVDGAALLSAIADSYTRHISLPEGGAEALALFVVHTYGHDAAYVSPLLAIVSPEKGCGKTSALSVTAELVRRPLSASNITAAALFRTVEKLEPTLLVDEADSFLRDNNELRGILNSGHNKAGAHVIRLVGDTHDPRVFSTWCPKAIATIGKLPPTLMDRAIVIPMRRKLANEHLQRVRLDRLHDELTPIRQKLQRWSRDSFEALRSADPAIPDQLHNRAADNWRPLLAIADLAGGEWPERARQALLVLSASVEDDGPAIQLLADLRDVFEREHADRLASAELVDALARMVERSWATWNHGRPIRQQQIARLLAPFGIKPRTMRMAERYWVDDTRDETRVVRGYSFRECEDAFARYLPPLFEARHNGGEIQNSQIPTYNRSSSGAAMEQEPVTYFGDNAIEDNDSDESPF